MNKERFLLFQNSIDKDLLEEAQNYRKEKVNWLRYAALAACFCAVIAGVLAWHPWRTNIKTAAVMASGAAAKEESAMEYSMVYDTFAAPEAAPMPEAAYDYEAAEPEEAAEARESNDSVMTFGAATALPNPVHECTLEELAESGYDMPLPDGAEPVFCAMINELAEVKFLYGGSEYLLRAKKTAESEDISGVYDSVRKALGWSDGGTEYELREGSEGIVFSWYSADDGVQWCLWSRDCGPETLLKTAGEIRGAEIPVPEEDMEDSK